MQDEAPRGRRSLTLQRDRYRDEERETRREQLLALLEEPGWQVMRGVFERRLQTALLAPMRPGTTLEKLAEYRAEYTLLRGLLEDPAQWFEETDG